MLLVLESEPCQDKEHDKEEQLNAKVLPLADAMLRQAIVLQKLQGITVSTSGLCFGSTRHAQARVFHTKMALALAKHISVGKRCN